MDELRESSLLFSLQGLLETERERVAREAREAQKRREDELLRVAEQAALRRQNAEQERLAGERRKRLEQQREQLEQERLEAMKRASVERARIQTEGELRLVEAEQARQHDLALARIREGQQASRYRLLTLLGSGACALTLIGAIGGYWGWIAPTHAREVAQLNSVATENETKATTTTGALTNERRQNEALRARVGELETTLAALRTAPPVVAASRPPAKPGHVSRPPRHTPTKKCKNSGDPLDDCY